MTNTIGTSLVRRLKSVLLLLTVSSFVAGARAEESSPAPTPEPAPESAEQTPSKVAKSRQQPGKPSGDFIPSEEISEDYAVSFPVDI